MIAPLKEYARSIKLYEDYGDDIGQVDYVQHFGSDIMFVNAARVSFGKHKDVMDENDEKLLRYMIEHKHTSPFEHASITFRFKVPLFVRGQHHRHRTWSYNEISRRYTDVNIEFYEPWKFRTQHKSNRQASNLDTFVNPNVYKNEVDENNRDVVAQYPANIAVRNFHEEALLLYSALLEAGVCREQARGVLPQNMYTEYYGTVNFSNLLKFVELRDHQGAQEEIARVARACLDIATDLFPISIKAYQEVKGDKDFGR